MKNPNPEILCKVAACRLEGGSINDIMSSAAISRNSASRYLNHWESTQPAELVEQIRKKCSDRLRAPREVLLDSEEIPSKGSKDYFQRRASELHRENNRLKAQLLLKQDIPPVLIKDNPTRVGYLAEYLVKYRVSRAGLEMFHPEFQAEACDLLVASPSNKSRFYRCEVKATRTLGGSIGITKPRFGGQYTYSDSDGIDFFVLVDLASEVVCVVPFSDIGSQTAFTLKPECFAWQYKDRFDLFV